ncbi:MAG: recombinase family protein [Nitrospinae bacterium]|nr:recombinase family protein [Nitrospinota bacterium]
MQNFAYLRVSKDTQDVEKQKFGILDYCNKKNIAPVVIVEDTESRAKSWRLRGIGNILKKVQKGDRILVAEVSRLGGSPLQVLEILEEAAKKEIAVHIVKSQMIMNGTLQSTIMATVLGLSAQIEREFISVRTKEALAKIKAEGVKLGRPKGPAKNVKLDPHKDQILSFLKKRVSKLSIAKIFDCSPSTLYAWLKRHKIKV